MEMNDYLKFVFALLFVLSLMGGLAYILKRLGIGHGSVMAGAKRRLKIIETLPIDARHKAVLIQRDDTQHLVVLNNSGDTVIETNIKKPEDDKKA